MILERREQGHVVKGLVFRGTGVRWGPWQVSAAMTKSVCGVCTGVCPVGPSPSTRYAVLDPENVLDAACVPSSPVRAMELSLGQDMLAQR